MTNQDLPYVFDLLWDIKTMATVEKIAKGITQASAAKPIDLYLLFESEGMVIPECLLECKSEIIYIEANGTWLTEPPLFEEAHRFRKAKYI